MRVAREAGGAAGAVAVVSRVAAALHPIAAAAARAAGAVGDGVAVARLAWRARAGACDDVGLRRHRAAAAPESQQRTLIRRSLSNP